MEIKSVSMITNQEAMQFLKEDGHGLEIEILGHYRGDKKKDNKEQDKAMALKKYSFNKYELLQLLNVSHRPVCYIDLCMVSRSLLIG